MMTNRDRHPIFLFIIGISFALLAGCENPVVTQPPTLTNDDIAEIVASTIGAGSGGMMMHMPDLVTAAHGGAIADRAGGGKSPSPLTDRRVRRHDTTNHDGKSYGYDLGVIYSYTYSSSTFPGQDQFSPKLDFLILKGKVTSGTFVTPTLTGTDSGKFSWYLRGLTLAEPTYVLDGSYVRHRHVTLLRKGLSLSLDVGIRLSLIRVDPSTGVLRTSGDTLASITVTNLRWDDGTPIVGSLDSLPLVYSGTLRIHDNGTAVLGLIDESDKGHFYPIDTKVGRVR